MQHQLKPPASKRLAFFFVTKCWDFWFFVHKISRGWMAPEMTLGYSQEWEGFATRTSGGRAVKLGIPVDTVEVPEIGVLERNRCAVNLSGAKCCEWSGRGVDRRRSGQAKIRPQEPRRRRSYLRALPFCAPPVRTSCFDGNNSSPRFTLNNIM
jgi:hypothetical protein